jgi:hypothetical protein
MANILSYIATNMAKLLERPTLEGESNNNSLCFSTRLFVAGDLAFFSLILGKENWSGKWCNWCMLSPKEWADQGHEKGEHWTIEKIYDIHRNVTENNLPETPQNIRGVTELSLIEAVPIENFILSVLHILIGMGNSLVDCFLEWVEERVEKLLPVEVEARNRVLYATVQYSNIQSEYKRWLETD